MLGSLDSVSGILTIGSPVALIAVATIFRWVTVVDPSDDLDGLGVGSWVEKGTAACSLIRAVTASEKVQAGEEKSITTWKCYFALHTDLLDSDQVVIAGFTYQVTGTDAGATNAAVLTAQLARVL